MNAQTTSYEYDGDGHRVKKADSTGTLVFVYDAAGRMVAEYGTNSSPVPGTSYLTADHLGSTRVVTKGDGSVRARYDYLPFGTEIASSYGGRNGVGYVADSTRQKFTGHERDSESGLDFAQARYCASVTGRFMSCDPYDIIMEVQENTNEDAERSQLLTYISNPQQWNHYSYVANNPLKYADPTGEKLELTGETPDERQKALDRIKAVVGDKAANLLYVYISEDKNGTHYYVGYNGKRGDGDRLAATSEIGVYIADIIDSDKTTEFKITKTFSTKNASNLSVNSFGGAATVGADESINGNTQIFVHPDAGNVTQLKFGSTMLSTMMSDDGKQLDFYNDIVDGHEFGHAWANVMKGITLRNSNESNPWALHLENLIRERRKMPNRRTKH